MNRAGDPSQHSLFRKNFLVLFAAVVIPLLANGGIEAWFGYRDQRAQLNDLLGLEARAAAARIQSFIDNIRDQLGWTVQLPLTAGAEERQRVDALSRLATSAHAPQPAQLEERVRVVRGVAPDPGD